MKRTSPSNRKLLDDRQTDQALRDLMPVVEWLTNADAARADGPPNVMLASLGKAFTAFRDIHPNSPAIKAYIRWLEQNTADQEAGNVTSLHGRIGA